MEFHTQPLSAIESKVKTHANGRADDVQSRLKEHGKNRLQTKKKNTWIVMFLAQFADVMILILIAAAVVVKRLISIECFEYDRNVPVDRS